MMGSFQFSAVLTAAVLGLSLLQWPGCVDGTLYVPDDVALSPGELRVYEAGSSIAESTLDPIGPPEALGGESVSGHMHLSVRTDLADSDTGTWAGVLQATRGTARFTAPAHRHVTVMSGSIVLTDEWGNTHNLGEGDSYLVSQGTTYTVRVKSRSVQTSFLGRRGTDAPAPPIVYRVGDEVPQDDLVVVGTPEDLGGTVISGEDVVLSARTDHVAGEIVGGVFQSTSVDVLIDWPFTEHAAMTKDSVTITDEVDNEYRLTPGDAFLVGYGTVTRWEQSDSFIQKSFLDLHPVP